MSVSYVCARGGGADAGGKLMNLRRIANKLQLALCQKGKYIKINQYQSYSEKSERMVTKFVLTEKRKTPAGKLKNFTILETYKMAEVVKELARMYGDA